MEDLIYDILAKHFTGETSVKEDEYLNSWLAVPQNKEIYKRFKTDWMNNMSAVEYNTDKAWNQVRGRIEVNQKINGRKQLIAVVSVAAILLVGLFIYTSRVNTNTPLTHYATVNETQEISLPDGSVVNLNVNSSIDIEPEFDKTTRTITLQGEAFFDVQKNPDKPFIIHVNNTQVQVLGTSFNIKSSSNNEFELAVKTGKVSITNHLTKQHLFVEKGQGVVLTNGEFIKKEAFNKNNISWHTKMLFFEFTPLNEAVQQINSAYNSQIKLVLDHSDCVINSKFDNEDLDDIVESICRAFNLKKETKNDSIFLYGTGCN